LKDLVERVTLSIHGSDRLPERARRIALRVLGLEMGVPEEVDAYDRVPEGVAIEDAP
jgi:hypothetical protein